MRDVFTTRPVFCALSCWRQPPHSDTGLTWGSLAGFLLGDTASRHVTSRHVTALEAQNSPRSQNYPCIGSFRTTITRVETAPWAVLNLHKWSNSKTVNGEFHTWMISMWKCPCAVLTSDTFDSPKTARVRWVDSRNTKRKRALGDLVMSKSPHPLDHGKKCVTGFPYRVYPTILSQRRMRKENPIRCSAVSDGKTRHDTQPIQVPGSHHAKSQVFKGGFCLTRLRTRVSEPKEATWVRIFSVLRDRGLRFWSERPTMV